VGTERCLYQIGSLRRLGPKDGIDLLQNHLRFPSELELHDIALNHPVYGQPLEGHFPASRSYAHELSTVPAKKTNRLATSRLLLRGSR
jgi:hypothetical protein